MVFTRLVTRARKNLNCYNNPLLHAGQIFEPEIFIVYTKIPDFFNMNGKKN